MTEFFVLVALLYASQCCLYIPRGAVLFWRFLGRARIVRGPRWAFAGLRPSSRVAIGERSPLIEKAGRVHWRGASRRFLRTDLISPEPRFDTDDTKTLGQDGLVLKVGSRSVLRCGSESSAKRVLDSFVSTGEPTEGLGSRLSEEASVEALRANRDRVDPILRRLGWVLDLYGLAWFVALPAAAASWGLESALVRVGPAILLGHFLAVMVFAWAQSRLGRIPRASRWTALFEAAAFPPNLLRGCHRLALEAAGRRHPCPVAIEDLPSSEGRAFLRSEWARLERIEPTAENRWLLGAEKRALTALAEEIGLSTDALTAQPRRRDPDAKAFCPVCFDEYVRGEGGCLDCGVPLTHFNEAEVEPEA